MIKAKHKGSSSESSSVEVLAPKILINSIYSTLNIINGKKAENGEFSENCGKSFRYSMDSLVYICSKISGLKEQKRFRNLDKVPLSSTILLHEIGRNYRKYMNLLLEHGIIETDNHYVVGDEERRIPGKCKCYRVAKHLMVGETVSYKITKKSLLGKLLAWKQKMFDGIESDEMLCHVYDMMQEFNIDLKSAILDKPGERKHKKGCLELELKKSKDINDGELYVHKDRYNRIHTNFTNLSKNIRKTGLRCHGEKVKEIDIISSQPTLLYALMNAWVCKCEEAVRLGIDTGYYAYEPSKRKDVRDKYVNSRNGYHGEKIYDCELNDNLNMLGFKDYASLAKEARRELKVYKNKLESGIYEFFQDMHYEFFWEKISRKAIKKQFVSYVFGAGKRAYNARMDELWGNFFPALRKLLFHMKSYDYRSLSHELQRSEGAFMFGKLAPALNEEGITYVTIHDSIAVPETQVQKALDIFTECLDEADFGGRVKVE